MFQCANKTQIHDQINTNINITKIQQINEHKLQTSTKTETTYPTDQNNIKSTLINSNEHRISSKQANQSTLAGLY